MNKIRINLQEFRFWWDRLGFSTRQVGNACGVSHQYALNVYNGDVEYVSAGFIAAYFSHIIFELPNKLNVTDFVYYPQAGYSAPQKINAQGTDSSLSNNNQDKSKSIFVKEKMG
jgi:hypothetical protein